MNKIKFFEALYTSCNSIVARRKSVVIPILTIVAGVALPIISTILLDGAEYDNINSVVILAGIALAVAGGVWTLGRLTGNGEPYSTKSGKFLDTRILSFSRSHRSEVFKAVGSRDLERLLAIPTCEVSAVSVMLSALPDNSFVAAQVFEYAELEYRELSRVTIIKD